MPNNSPTIVSAALSDKELQDSINRMVANFDKGLQDMLEHSNDYVGKIQKKLQEIGSTKFDFGGGKSDSGTSKSAANVEKLQKKYDEATTSLQKHQTELDNAKTKQQGLVDAENAAISAKDRAAQAVASYNEQLKRQEAELAQLKGQQQSLADAEQRGAQGAQQQSDAINAQRAAVEKIKSELESYSRVIKNNEDAMARMLKERPTGFGSTLKDPAILQAVQQDKKLQEETVASLDKKFEAFWAKQEKQAQQFAQLLKKDINDISFDDFYKHVTGKNAALAKSWYAHWHSVDYDRTYLFDQDHEMRLLERLKWLRKDAASYKDRDTYAKVSPEFAEELKLLESLKRRIDEYNKKKYEAFSAQPNMDAAYDKFKAEQKQYDQHEAIANAVRERMKTSAEELTRGQQKLRELEQQQAQATQQSAQASQQKAQVDAQVAAKEKEIADTKKQIADASKAQSDAEKQATEVAKQRATVEGQVATADKNVTEARKNLETATRNLNEAQKQSSGSADGGASKQVKAQKDATDATEKRIQKEKELNLTLDQQAQALKLGFARAWKIPTSDLDLAQTKMEHLESYMKSMREKGLMSPTQIASAEAEIRKIRQMLSSTEQEQNKITQATQQTTQSAQRYNEEIRKQATAIRETQQWKEKGYAMVGDRVYYDTERSNLSKKTRLSLEEQILNVQKEEAAQAESQARAEQRELAEKQAAAQAAQQQLGIEQQITQEQQKRSTQSQPKTFASYDDLRQSIAHVLGLQQQQVKLADTERDSYNKLSETLRQLKQAYDRLNASERNSEQGKALVASIHEVEREMQKIQAQASRPTNIKNVMGLDEKTLDDIAYKMRQLQSYRSGLNVDTQKKEIGQVNAEYDRLKKKMDEVMQKNQNMIASNTALARSWNYMKNRLAFYFTVGASTQFVKNLIEVRSQYEMNERALGILINSAERGSQIFNELSQMALVSPYTLIELSSAAKQLAAYDMAAKDVVDTTRRLADMASAVGIPIERLTYALGQIKAYGYLNSRDVRMFANAGIPLVKQLSEYYTELEGRLVSTADVYDRIKKKAIDYNDVMQVINKMTDEGGKFFDFQAKMADTLKVRLANLTLAWNNMLNDIGKESQGLLTWGIGALRDLFLQWRTLDKLIKEFVVAFGAYKGIQLLIYGLQWATKTTLGLNKSLTATGILGTKLTNIFRTLGGAMKALAANWWLVLVAAAVELVSAINNANEATKEFNKSMREGAESTSKDLQKYVEQYKELRDSLYTTETKKLPNGKTQESLVPKDMNAQDAQKAWESMREQIELSSAASNEFIARLLQINNVSDRLREGFKIIDDILQVNNALKEMGDEALVVTQEWSAWWNAWQAPDGLFTNLKDFKKELDAIREKYGDIANARYVAEHGDINQAADRQDAIMRSASDAVNDYDRNLKRFKVDLDKYTTSLDNFANAMGFSANPTQIAELYAKAVKQLVTQGQLNPQEAFDLQLQIEEARTNAMKLALKSRIADEENALKIASDERTKQSLSASIESNKSQLALFEKSTAEETAYWNDFTRYIKERHISEMTAAYNAMTDNGKKAADFQSQEWQNYVHKWANAYEKSHNLATDSVFNRLKNWINDANTWSVFIKMTISTEDTKSVYKELGEWDKAADEAYKTMQRLDKEISRLRKKGAHEVEGLGTGVFDESVVSADDKKLTKAIEERTQAQKDYNEAVANGGESKKKDAAGSKAQKAAESELQKALKDEIQLIDKVRSTYKSLTKEGVDSQRAISVATSGFDESVANINKVLGKYGIGKLDLTKFAGVQNPRAVMDMLQAQLDKLMKSGVAKPSEIKDLQVKLKDLKVDSITFDQKTITSSLNNELSKLKDEYELAVELDANPELGDVFADMMGINTDTLPRTINEYATEMTKLLNKYLQDKNANLVLPSMDLTDDDLRAFEKQVESQKMTQEAYDIIKKQVLEIRSLRKKDAEETMKDWNTIIEKYGGLQAQILKIYKDNVQQQLGIVKKFGDEQQKKQAIDLSDKINISQDPAEIARLQEQLAQLMKSVTENNPVAVKVYAATQNEQGAQVAKTYWEDFKNSDLYTMTFEDMANNSTRAIQLIIDKMNGLKDKVKEDPASMKALIKSLEDAEKELNTRDPFGGVARSLKAMAEASNEAKLAQQALWRAEVDVEQAQKAYDESEDGTPEEQKAAQEALATAIQKRAQAQTNLTKAENKGKKAHENLKGSLQGIANELGDVKELFDTVSKLFRAGGDDETADAIDAISEGFSVMITVIMGVIAALVLLETTNPWLLAIAAALSVIVGLVSFLSSHDNKKIDKKVKESERAVKRLELAYIDLEHAVKEAFGTATAGAQQAIKANKELQLAELKRQLRLEQARSSKNRDEDRIIELRKSIVELEYEIQNATKEAVNELLNISSHGDFFESLISDMISAFKNGEDAMAVFEEKWAEMIDNMITKQIVSQVLSMWIKTLEKGADEILEKHTKESSEQVARTTAAIANMSAMDAGDLNMYLYKNAHNLWETILEELGEDVPENPYSHFHGFVNWFEAAWGSGLSQKMADSYSLKLNEWLRQEQERLEADSMAATGDLIDYYQNAGEEFKEKYLDTILDKLKEHWTFGQDSQTELSSLQQGIKGITEDTAGALESYMNIVSQKMFEQNDVLIQIRDTMQGFDLDLQLGTLSEILLQLQSSYQIQMSIRDTLQGWSNASGMAVRVEMI